MKSTDVLTPELIAAIVASQGSVNVIPTEPTGTPFASQKEGFPAITMLPKTSGGQNPDGRDFNGLLKLLSSHTFFLQNGSAYTFNPSVANAIGGYPLNAVLWNFPQNEPPYMLVSQQDDNMDNFVSNPSVIGSSWVKSIDINKFIKHTTEISGTISTDNAGINYSVDWVWDTYNDGSIELVGNISTPSGWDGRTVYINSPVNFTTSAPYWLEFSLPETANNGAYGRYTNRRSTANQNNIILTGSSINQSWTAMTRNIYLVMKGK